MVPVLVLVVCHKLPGAIKPESNLPSLRTCGTPMYAKPADFVANDVEKAASPGRNPSLILGDTQIGIAVVRGWRSMSSLRDWWPCKILFECLIAIAVPVQCTEMEYGIQYTRTSMRDEWSIAVPISSREFE